jgi:hypothetical protein
MRGPLPVWGSVAALAMLPFALPAQQSSAAPGWRTSPPSGFTLTGQFRDRRLNEASGAAPSRSNPGLFWTIGDSGNPPELLAIDTTGALLGRFALQNTANIDWEAVAVGPCPQGSCVYVGDIGDNAERRSEVMIHRVREPMVRETGPVTLSAVETLRVRYPNQPHDVEAMGVAPDGTIVLVTKGRSRGVLVYHISPEAWGMRAPVVPTRVDSLPIAPSGGIGRQVTDLAIDSTGTRVVVRTYRDLFLFERASTGRLTPIRACDIVGREPQGEGVAWMPDGRLLLTSERGLFRQGTVNIVSCS